MEFSGGLILTKQGAWIQYPSQVPQDIQEPPIQVPRIISLQLLYAYPYAIHTYSANTLLRRTLFTLC